MDEDIDTSGMTINERVAILMDELPVPVQNFLRGPDRDAVSLALARKYQLHADTAGIFERAYIYMLLGVYTPDEFVAELREGGIGEETIRGLTADVNEQVFKRLREEERTGVPASVVPPARPQVPVMEVGNREAGPPANLPGQVAPPQPIYQPPSPVAAPLPAPAVAIPVPLPPPVLTAAVLPPSPVPPPVPIYSAPPIPTPPIYQAPPQPLSYAPPVSPAYAPPAAPSSYQPPAPPPVPIYSAPVPYPPVPVETYRPVARTMERDMELAEQGFQGQESFVPSFQSSPAAQAAQTYAPALAPVVPFPQPAAAPPSAPIPVPEPQASSYPPPVMASVRLTPVDRGYADAPITKEFGSDPYREPIE